MSNSKFKPGDEVTMRHRKPWGFLGNLNYPHRLPNFGEIYIVSIVAFEHGFWCMGLVGFPEKQGFLQDDFEKVVSDSVLSEELASVPEPFTL